MMAGLAQDAPLCRARSHARTLRNRPAQCPKGHGAHQIGDDREHEGQPIAAGQVENISCAPGPDRGAQAAADGDDPQDGAEIAPHLLSIATRAEEVLDRFEDRQETTEAALASLNELADEWFHAKAEAEDSGFDTNTFGIFWLLGQRKVAAARDLAPVINYAISVRPAFRDNPAELRLLKADLYRILLPVVGKDEMVAVVDELLRLSRK